MLLSWTMLADKHLKTVQKVQEIDAFEHFEPVGWLLRRPSVNPLDLGLHGLLAWESPVGPVAQKNFHRKSGAFQLQLTFLSQFEKARWICIFTYQKKLGGLGYARFTESLKVLALRKFNVLSNRCCLFSVLDTLPHSRSLECCVLLCVALKPHIFALGCLAWHALTVKHIGIYKECHVNVMVCCAHM